MYQRIWKLLLPISVPGRVPICSDWTRKRQSWLLSNQDMGMGGQPRTSEVYNKTVCVAESVKNVGVYFNTSLMMEKQLNLIFNACYYHICNFGSIRCYNTRNACKILANALIISRLDYDNALLCGLPCILRIHIKKRVQNSAAWLVTHAQNSI